MNLRQSGLLNSTGSSGKNADTVSKVPIVYDNKLEDYRSTLDKYKNYFLNIPNKMLVYSKNLMEGQLSSIQIAVALTYMKEQMDQSKELLGRIIKTQQENAVHERQELAAKEVYTEQLKKARAMLEEIKNEQLRSMQETLETTVQTAVELASIREQSEKTLGTIEAIKTDQTKSIQDVQQSIANLADNAEKGNKAVELLTEIKAQQDKKLDVAAQTSADLDFIKTQSVNTMELLSVMKSDQEKKAQEQLENLITSIIETNFKLDEMDKGIVNRVTEMSSEVQRLLVYQNKQLLAQKDDNMERVQKDVRKNSNLIWFVIGFQILGLSALAALILYQLEIIPF